MDSSSFASLEQSSLTPATEGMELTYTYDGFEITEYADGYTTVTSETNPADYGAGETPGAGDGAGESAGGGGDPGGSRAQRGRERQGKRYRGGAGARAGEEQARAHENGNGTGDSGNGGNGDGNGNGDNGNGSGNNGSDPPTIKQGTVNGPTSGQSFPDSVKAQGRAGIQLQRAYTLAELEWALRLTMRHQSRWAEMPLSRMHNLLVDGVTARNQTICNCRTARSHGQGLRWKTAVSASSMLRSCLRMVPK